MRIIDAAWELFTAGGYAATSVSAVAQRAGVSVDTLYASIGRKPELVRAVIESSISGLPQAVPAEMRDYVMAIRAAGGAAQKIALYAETIARLSPRTAPITLALKDAARTDAVCAALAAEIDQRRATNMRLFAADLLATGELAAQPAADAIGYIADVVWATAGAEHYTALVSGRGWTSEEFGRYLQNLWMKLFLAPSAG